MHANNYSLQNESKMGVRELVMEIEDSDVDESMDLENGGHLEIVGKCCYLGDMLNKGGGLCVVRGAWWKRRCM